MRLATALVLPLLLVSCSSGSKSSSPGVATTGAADAQTVTVDMGDDLKVAPAAITAKVGTVTLTVTNGGLVPHNLQFDDTALGKTSTVDGKTSQDLKVRFDKAGSFSFACSFHPGMTGKVTVSP